MRDRKIHGDYCGVDQGRARWCGDADAPFVEAAIKEAKRSPMNQKHGCVVAHNNRLLSSAHNDMPDMFRNSVHAEVNALKKLKNRPELLKRCVLYVIRIGPDSSNNLLKYSKPCAACARFIRECGVRTVFYSTNREYDDYCVERCRRVVHSTESGETL